MYLHLREGLEAEKGSFRHSRRRGILWYCGAQLKVLGNIHQQRVHHQGMEMSSGIRSLDGRSVTNGMTLKTPQSPFLPNMAV